MRSILFLLPDLGFHSYSRQASLLAPTLPCEQFSPRLFSLKGEGPFAEALRQARIPILEHEHARHFNLATTLSLRKTLVDEKPALVHVWGRQALRILGWATLFRRSLLPPLIVSLDAYTPRTRRLNGWERRLFEHVRAFIVMDDAEREVCSQIGFPAERMHVIPPGVPLPGARIDCAGFRATLGVESHSPLLMGVGHLEQADRFRDSIWAYEILQMVKPAIQLVLIGGGRYRHGLERRFLSARQKGRGLHFLGGRADAADLVRCADVVLTSHRQRGGTFSTLEAMAASRPVVATNLPHLATLIRDGQNGLLVPPGDQPTMARAILRLLEEPDLRERLGTAARHTAEKEFRLETMTARFADLYESVLNR